MNELVDVVDVDAAMQVFASCRSDAERLSLLSWVGAPCSPSFYVDDACGPASSPSSAAYVVNQFAGYAS